MFCQLLKFGEQITTRGLVIACILSCSSLAYGDTTKAALTRLHLGCSERNISVGFYGFRAIAIFSPAEFTEKGHRETIPSDRRWGPYHLRHVGNKLGYSNDRVRLDQSRKNKIRISLLRDIELIYDSTPIKLPPAYIWHVISVPRPANWTRDVDAVLADINKIYNHTGILPTSLTEYRHLPKLTSDQYTKYLDISYVSTYDDPDKLLLAYNRAAPPKSKEITALWQGFLSVPFWQKIIEKSLLLRKQAEDNNNVTALRESQYVHTFYFWPIKNALNKVDKENRKDAEWTVNHLRQASYKTITTPGRAFGFIFDPLGSCLASSILEIECGESDKKCLSNQTTE